MKEKEIEKLILQWLSFQPRIFVWKQNTTGIYDEKKQVFRALKGFAKVGISDILMCISPHGRFGAIEVKTPERARMLQRQNGFPCTLEQKYFIDSVNAHGGVAGVATSLEDAVKLMEPVLHGSN